jgi:hypothetical protein
VAVLIGMAAGLKLHHVMKLSLFAPIKPLHQSPTRRRADRRT